MKRIQYACVEQTIHFRLKEEAPKDVVRMNVKNEMDAYINLLTRRNTKFKIVEEIPQEDGSIILKIKKQFNLYDCGDYLN